MSLNKVMLIGNVGADPEVRYLDPNSPNGNGGKVASFRLATTERYKDRSGELRENTEWHSITVWRNTADVVEKFVKKGTQLYVEGRIRTRSWTDQTGAKRYSTEIVADTLQLLGRKSDNPGAPEGGWQSASPQQPAYQAPQQPVSPAPSQPAYQAPQQQAEPTDDLPF